MYLFLKTYYNSIRKFILFVLHKILCDSMICSFIKIILLDYKYDKCMNDFIIEV